MLARVGSPDYFDDRRAGQVDMTRAVRSPGSTLKPFIYGLAFEDGLGGFSVHIGHLFWHRHPIGFGPVETAIAHDREQPRFGRLTMEGRKPPEGPDERILHDIFCRRRITPRPPRFWLRRHRVPGASLGYRPSGHRRSRARVAGRA